MQFSCHRQGAWHPQKIWWHMGHRIQRQLCISWLSISIIIYMKKLSKHILLATIYRLCYVNLSTGKIKFYKHVALFINLSKRYLWVGLQMRALSALHFTSLPQLMKLSKLIYLAVKSSCCHTKLLYRIIQQIPRFQFERNSSSYRKSNIFIYSYSSKPVFWKSGT